MTESKTEAAVMAAYLHYRSKAKESDVAYWKDTAEVLQIAYEELKQYHKIKELLFPPIKTER